MDNSSFTGFARRSELNDYLRSDPNPHQAREFRACPHCGNSEFRITVRYTARSFVYRCSSCLTVWGW